MFGHTHKADLARLGDSQGARADYFNTGTWTKCFAETCADALVKLENEFVFFRNRELPMGMSRIPLRFEVRWRFG